MEGGYPCGAEDGVVGVDGREVLLLSWAAGRDQAVREEGPGEVGHRKGAVAGGVRWLDRAVPSPWLDPSHCLPACLPCFAFQALKAYALERTGRADEALSLCREVAAR